MKRSDKTWPSPVGRARCRLEYHAKSDGNGVPPAVILTGGNRNDVTGLVLPLGAIPSVRHGVGRPRRRPNQVFADHGDDHDKYRRLVRAKAVTRRPLRHRARIRPGRGVLGDRAQHRLIPRYERPAHVLRAQRRHPRGLPKPCDLHHHLALRTPIDFEALSSAIKQVSWSPSVDST